MRLWPATVAAARGPWRPFEAATVSDVGLARATNQDAFVSRSAEGLWAVADGMGGHQDGERAAQIVAEHLERTALSGRPGEDASRLADAIQIANGSLFAEAQARGVRMGSTVVALTLGDDAFSVVWAGDSRAYRLRNGVLAQLTRDHTHVQDRVDRGLMTPAQAVGHPMAHVLSRAVGAQASLQLDTVQGDAEENDRFLLCSDGLHGVVEAPEIAAALAEGPPRESCRRLLDLCLARGAPDNVTIVIVACPPGT